MWDQRLELAGTNSNFYSLTFTVSDMVTEFGKRRGKKQISV